MSNIYKLLASLAEEQTVRTLGGVDIKIGKSYSKPEDAIAGYYSTTNPSDSKGSILDHQLGCLFSSGFDFPGRHSRWDIAFSKPSLEFSSFERTFQISSLDDQGSEIIELIYQRIKDHDHIEKVELANSKENLKQLNGILLPPPKHFPEEKRSRQASIFSILRAISHIFCSDDNDLSYFGFYGAFGYDLVHQFENLEKKLQRDSDHKDCRLFLPLEIIVVDRKKEIACTYKYSVITNSQSNNSSTIQDTTKIEKLKTEQIKQSQLDSKIKCDHQEGEFAKKVQKVIDRTKKGDFFEAILSQEFSTAFTGSSSELFSKLAQINPSPYMFLLNFGDEQLIGASPEVFVRVEGKRYETAPISGTVRRGESAIEDAKRVAALIASKKEESELTMCTDVDRNDMARVCKPGSVKILGRRQLEFYSHVIHTVDHVEGELLDECDGLDAFQSHMWACTVTGAPKPAAMQCIEDYENSPRRWYAGAVGAILFNGNVNTGITLRSAEVRNGIASIRAGATILYGSDPKLEEEETRNKAAAFLNALKETKSTNKTVKKEISTKKDKKVFLIDCRDSFVFNLASYCREYATKVITYRAGFPIEILDQEKPDLVIISPGPDRPSDFGLSEVIAQVLARKIPLFGVCLGHQGIGEYFGSKLEQLPEPMHGKEVEVSHNGDLLFNDIPSNFNVGLYHSLYLPEESLSNELEITAKSIIKFGNTELSVPMAIRHKTLPISAVQFHPESLLSLENHSGHKILKNLISNL